MAEAKKAKSVKLFFGLLLGEKELYSQLERQLTVDFTGFDFKSAMIPFTHTDYYQKEMGGQLWRIWLSGESLIQPDELPGIKLATNLLEQFFAHDGKRRVNIDPGYLDLSKVVLASCKDYNHRLFLARGVYGEVTLSYRRAKQSYVPWEWTYPDYRIPEALQFFNHLRELYRTQIQHA